MHVHVIYGTGPTITLPYLPWSVWESHQNQWSLLTSCVYQSVDCNKLELWRAHTPHTAAMFMILARVIDLKQSLASFFLPHLTVWSYLQFTQMPTSGDLAIFVPTTTTTDGQTDYFTPCAHTCGVMIAGVKSPCLMIFLWNLMAFHSKLSWVHQLGERVNMSSIAPESYTWYN